MRKTACFLLALVLLLFGMAHAYAEMEQLTGIDGVQVFLADNGVDTVVRPEDQPYFGQIDKENASLCIYLDFLQSPNDEDIVFMRLTLAIETWDPVNAETIAVEAGKNRYVFEVKASTSEYDQTYYEDYELYMTDLSLPMIAAMASAKTSEWKFVLYGNETVEGSITMPADMVKKLYKAYRNECSQKVQQRTRTIRTAKT